MHSRPRAQVVGHALQPLKKIQPQEPDAANEREDKKGQNDRRAFERFELHRAQLNKKPEQLKAALVSLIKKCKTKTKTTKKSGRAQGAPPLSAKWEVLFYQM
jgi:hypothetical protein